MNKDNPQWKFFLLIAWNNEKNCTITISLGTSLLFKFHLDFKFTHDPPEMWFQAEIDELSAGDSGRLADKHQQNILHAE